MKTVLLLAATASVTLFLVSGCAPADEGADGSGTAATTSSCTHVSATAEKCAGAPVKLRFADEHGIGYSAFRIQYTGLGGQPESAFGYSFEFAGLTKESFDLLMDHYGGQNYVAWDPARSNAYELLDFLPPKIQALTHRTLKQEYVPFAEGAGPTLDFSVRKYPTQEYETGMHCVDTVYEVVRDLGSSPEAMTGMTAHVGARIVDAMMKQPSGYESKEVLSPADFDPSRPSANRSRGRRVGDAFLIDNVANMGQGAAHAMIWLDDDVFFEKPNMATSDPFRIVTWADGAKSWVADADDDTLKVTVYRFKNLPKAWEYAGKHYFYDWTNRRDTEGYSYEGLSEDLRKNFMFNLDVSLGGGLGTQRINPIRESALVPDAKGRASYADATKLGFATLY